MVSLHMTESSIRTFRAIMSNLSLIRDARLLIYTKGTRDRRVERESTICPGVDKSMPSFPSKLIFQAIGLFDMRCVIMPKLDIHVLELAQ